MSTDFELGGIPRRVPMCGTGDVAPLRLIVRVVTVNVQRDLELEDLVALVPIDMRIETDERLRVQLRSSRHRVQRNLQRVRPRLTRSITKQRTVTLIVLSLSLISLWRDALMGPVSRILTSANSTFVGFSR